MRLTLGEEFVAALVHSADITQYSKYAQVRTFMKPIELESFEVVAAHVTKFGVLPKPNTLENDAGLEIGCPDEPPGYYFEKLKQRYIRLSLIAGVQEANDTLKENPEKTLEFFRDLCSKLTLDSTLNQVVDLRDAEDYVWPMYTQRRTKKGNLIMTGWSRFDDMTGGVSGGDVVSFVGRPSQGKALPVGTPILLPDGSMKPIGDLQVGDRIASVDGRESKVFGVYDQGLRDLIVLKFSDGRELKSDHSHLWEVHCKYWKTPRVMTSQEIHQRRGEAKRYCNTLKIRLFDGVTGSTKPSVDPYVLGALLGDGSFRDGTPRIVSMDSEILKRIQQRLPNGVDLRLNTSSSTGLADDYSLSGVKGGLNPLTAELRAFGLMGSKSEAKFIPDQCFMWDRDSRLELLRGLMDTDGCAGKDGSSTYSSSSRKLIDGVIRLVRSLGGWAKLQREKETTHLPHFRISVSLRDIPFHLPRKANRIKSEQRQYLTIVESEVAGREECRCIAVTHPSRLYVAGDYVVTHNSQMLVWASLNAWNAQRLPVMLVSMEMPVEQIIERSIGVYSRVPLAELRCQRGRRVPTSRQKRLKEELAELRKGDVPLYIIDGNLGKTVPDIQIIARQLQPAAIYIDGGYLLEHPDGKLQANHRIAANSRMLKMELSSALKIPVFCTWQINREGSKSKLSKGQKFGMEHVAGSDSISQDSSIICGLMEEENPSNMHHRNVQIVKGRHGEDGEFQIAWDWERMNFGDPPEEEPVVYVEGHEVRKKNKVKSGPRSDDE